MTATPTPPNPQNTPAPAGQAGQADRGKKDRRLGRGLSSLISMPAPATTPAPAGPVAVAGPHAAGAAPADVPHAMLAQIPVRNIEPNPLQPRRQFDEASLAELADSIRANGLVQPILVRRRRDAAAATAAPGSAPAAASAEAKYQLVAGERRWRAAKAAGLESVPAIVRSVTDDALLEVALTENLHRSDLNPMERAAAYAALMNQLHITQDALAAKLGENRHTVMHHLRLLQLPESVQEMVWTGRLTYGHVRAISRLTQADNQLRMAQVVLEEDWSVRRVEQMLADLVTHPDREKAFTQLLRVATATPEELGKGAPSARPEPPPKPAHILALEEKLTRRLGTRVAIHESRRPNIGKVIIDYYSLDEFDRILDELNIQRD